MTLMYRRAMAGAWAVAVSIALTGSARAVSLSFSYERALIQGYRDTCGVSCPGLGSVSVAASYNSIQAQASAAATNAPALSASASGGGDLNTDATAGIDYYLEWLDSTPGAGPIPTLVDLVLHTAASADASDVNSTASAAATFNISPQPYTTITQPVIGTSRLVSIAGGAGPLGALGIYCQTHTCNNPADYSGTLLYKLSPNVLYKVEIAVAAGTSDSEGGIGSTLQSAEASLDPHIYLAPHFNDPGLTLELSQDLDNVVRPAATPLPAALPLFATGLGGLGLLSWRRKKKAALLAA